MTETRVEVGQAENFPEGSITPLVVGGREIVVICQEGKYYAVPDRCTHERYPLHDGELLDGKIKCVHHGATFDLQTGRATLPAIKKLQIFTTDLEEGKLFVVMQEA